MYEQIHNERSCRWQQANRQAWCASLSITWARVSFCWILILYKKIGTCFNVFLIIKVYWIASDCIDKFTFLLLLCWLRFYTDMVGNRNKRSNVKLPWIKYLLISMLDCWGCEIQRSFKTPKISSLHIWKNQKVIVKDEAEARASSYLLDNNNQTSSYLLY